MATRTSQPATPPGGGGGPAPYTPTQGGATATPATPAQPTTVSPLDGSVAAKSFTISSPAVSTNTFSETGQLITLLDALEKGNAFQGVGAATIQAAYKAAGLSASSALNAKRLATLKKATTGLITKNLNTLGIVTDSHPETATNAKGVDQTAQQFRQEQIPIEVKAKLETEGYNLDGVSSVATLVDTLAKQPAASKTTNGTMTGQEIYNSFQSRISTPAGAAQMAALMNSAGMTDGTIAPTDNAGLLGAFQKAMGETPAGSDPYTYLQGQAQKISAAGIAPGQKPNSAYAYVQGLAETIWGKGVLNDSDINSIAAEYPNAGSSAADDAAIRQDVARVGAQNWNYDPNQLASGGSYLASVINTVQDTAGQYAINMSPSVISGIVKDTLETGDLSSIYAATDAATANSEQHMKSMAGGLYPALKPLISQGFSVQQIMDPYKTMAANTLGRASSDINLEDPQWASLLTTPEGQLPSLDQFKATVMQDPRFDWQHSQDAATKYANMAQTLVSTWGKTGGGPVPYSDSVPSSTSG